MSSYLIEEAPPTPEPIKARINNLQSQVTELVRKEHGLNRRHKAESAELQSKLSQQTISLKETASTLEITQNTLKVVQTKLESQGKEFNEEMRRCKAEGEAMREELNLHSLVQQQRTILALAQEQMQMIELEHRLVKAETARIMRDHKIALFQAKEEELLAEMAERDARVEQLEVGSDREWHSHKISLSAANTSLAHQKAAQLKAGQNSKAESELTEARSEIVNLQHKITKLESSLKASKEKEKEARSELEALSNGNNDTDERRELKTALKKAKTELQRKTEELADLQEELTTSREASKEREKALKAKFREANEERAKLAGIEEELESLKASAKNLKPPKEKSRKATPVADDSEPEVAPKKKAKKPEVVPESDEDIVRSKKTVKPKSKSASSEVDGDKAEKKKKRVSPEPEIVGAVVPEKKKKRILLNTQSNFTWDPIMNSGDGVIPAYLSPLKPNGTAIGAIPRAGFPSISSRLGRF